MLEKIGDRIKKIYNKIMKKTFLRVTFEYITFFLIFECALQLTQVILLKILVLEKSEMIIFLNNPIIDVFIFTVIFFAILIGLYIYDKASVKQLNESLDRMNKRLNKDNNNFK